MENTVFNDSTVCCICFEIQNEAIPLYTQEYGIPLYEKLLNYTNINLNIEESIKALICRRCLNELKVCVQFLTKCLKASEYFKHAKSTGIIHYYLLVYLILRIIYFYSFF